MMLIDSELMLMSTGGFGVVFINQSFWQSAIVARPTSAVWGYLFGAVAWFGIPLMLSFTFGMWYLNGAAMLGTQFNGSSISATSASQSRQTFNLRFSQQVPFNIDSKIEFKIRATCII